MRRTAALPLGKIAKELAARSLRSRLRLLPVVQECDDFRPPTCPNRSADNARYKTGETEMFRSIQRVFYSEDSARGSLVGESRLNRRTGQLKRHSFSRWNISLVHPQRHEADSEAVFAGADFRIVRTVGRDNYPDELRWSGGVEVLLKETF